MRKTKIKWKKENDQIIDICLYYSYMTLQCTNLMPIIMYAFAINKYSQRKNMTHLKTAYFYNQEK